MTIQLKQLLDGKYKDILTFRNAKLCYYGALWLFLEAFIFGYVDAPVFNILSNISFGIMLLLLLTGSILVFFDGNYRRKLSLQLTGVFVLLSLFWDVNFIATENTSINLSIAVIGLVSLNISAVLFLIDTVRRNDMQSIRKVFTNREIFGLFFVVLLFALLSIQDFGFWFKGDVFVYYNSIIKGKYQWDFTLNTLSAFLMGGHTAYSYSFFLFIGEHLWHNDGNGIRLMNILLSEAMIVCFYAIVHKLFPDFGKIQKTLLTFSFAFAPLLFGISYLVSTDFPLLCFFVFFVFAYIYDLKIIQWLSVLALCFSKEIGIMIVFGFYLGECIYCACQKKKKNWFLRFIKECFRGKRIFLYLGVFFYVVPMLLLSEGWMKNLRALFSREPSSGVSLPNRITKWHYYFYKAEELFIMNYMWIIVLAGVILLVYKLIQYGRKRNVKIKLLRSPVILPLLTSWLMFLLVSMFYFTYVHYRYVQLNLFFMILFLGVLGTMIKKERLRTGLLGVVALLFFCQNYVMIDPLTYFLFPKFDAGNQQVVSTKRYFYEGRTVAFLDDDDFIIAKNNLHESLDYNRQQFGLQKVLEKAFSSIDYSSEKLVVLDNFGGTLQNDCWQLLGENKTDCYYWNSEKETVTKDTEDEKLNLQTDMAGASIKTDGYKEVYYFDFTFNPYIKDTYLENKTPLDKFDVSSGAWKIQVYRLK